MKKYLIPALSIALLTASVATLAHMPHASQDGTHPGPGHQAMLTPEMRALQEEMHSKMAAAKTPEERQALMAEHQAKMKDKMPGMAGMPNMAMAGPGQKGPMGQMGQMGPMGRMGGMGGMGGMGPMNMQRHQQMMQEQRPQSGG